MNIHVNLKENSYSIYMEDGILHHIKEYTNLNRKVMIITDDNIPKEYIEIIKKQCLQPFVEVVKAGEQSKSFPTFKTLCSSLLKHNFSRKDCVLALGGGVIGDLAGYVASSYMRGIDFIQVPTTTLSQIDSSIGGKVAINLDGVKNVIGAFYQPKAVFIDHQTLATLPPRHFYNGLVEALKAGLIYDAQLFALFEDEHYLDHLDEIMYRALCVKKEVVEIDEKEMGLRKILNFGHTIGHAIESYYSLSEYYHGECVSFGMLYFVSEDIKKRLLPIYKRMHLPQTPCFNQEEVFRLLTKDKKASGNDITIVSVNEIGKAQLEKHSIASIKEVLRYEK